ncbi:curli production assembly/transport component CsgF [Gilvibacter sediminis]|uniref:curli production assembly/transport component CsgF n=1 Tax=Gilvibacter sediminis TaxID=379071 RepID=UPI0023504187|nr:curli production assembly/transport component CsgF [Gilvibacter sediminis]MDC7999345.1 curli assembly protein CsgF [Gilvibacter sediminis]
MRILLTLLLFGIAQSVSGQELVYRAVNPAFGGDTFNYNWLLNSANAQNGFNDVSLRDDQSTLDNFAESINRQVLGQLTRSLFTSQLGDGLEAGTYSFGTLALEIFDSAEGLVVNILDTSTGEQTQIIIPN